MSGITFLYGLLGCAIMFGLEMGLFAVWQPPTWAFVILAIGIPNLGLAGGYLVGFRREFGEWW